MNTLSETKPRIVFLGSHKAPFGDPLLPYVSFCHDRSEVEAAVISPTTHVTWISSTRQFTDILLEKAVASRAALRGAHLITLTPPRSQSIPALLGLFHPVFGLVEGFKWLAKNELVEAITLDDAADRFIGGIIDPKAKTLTLLRGDIKPLVAPLAIFQKSGDGTAPDFARLKLTDFGRTIALGDYEASTDSILYELDADYRRRLKKVRRQSERTFGASLRRLRRQWRLKRSDFAPISVKEIARLERNEIVKPHAKTLKVIAARLGVPPTEIETF
jgi:hypothetical protein